MRAREWESRGLADALHISSRPGPAVGFSWAMAALGAAAAAAQLWAVPSSISDSCCSTSASFSPAKPQCHAKPLLPKRCPLGKCGLSSLTSWNGHLHLGPKQIHSLFKVWERRTREGSRGVVEASLLGVGAPEALVIAVVALIVFGPRGLAEVARTVGKSLRAFQPTIKELQQVSREFRSTLEQEIGLDELRGINNPSQYSTPPAAPASKASDPPATAAPPAETIPETLESPAASQAVSTAEVPLPTPEVASEAAVVSSPTPAAPPKQPATRKPRKSSKAAEASSYKEGETPESVAEAALKQVDEQLSTLKKKVRASVPEEDRLAAERAAWGGKSPSDLQTKSAKSKEASPPQSINQESQVKAEPTKPAEVDSKSDTGS